MNTANKYGHNYRGLYCTCNRPYPDPESENEVCLYMVGGGGGGGGGFVCGALRLRTRYVYLWGVVPEDRGMLIWWGGVM